MGQENRQTPSASPGAAESALRRKAASGRAEHGAKAMTLQKALRLSLAKTADQLFDMAMAVLSLRTENAAGTDLPNFFDEKALLILLEGRHGRRAAALIDLALVDALVQQQTMGRVLPMAEGDGRPVTGTDAALCAPFLDSLFERSAAMPEAPEERHLLTGLRFSARAEDPRQLSLALQAQDYVVCQIGVDIAGGTRQGQMTLCLPLPEEMEFEALEASNADPEGDLPLPGARKNRLRDAVMELNADLMVSIAQLRMPLRRLERLAPGATLDLPLEAFEEARIVDRSGQVLARGSLGQVEGCRAVRITPRAKPEEHPRRRASDRATLDQEEVLEHGLDPVLSEEAAGAELPLFDLPTPTAPPDIEAPDFATVADLGDLSDLPELADLPPLEGTGS